MIKPESKTLEKHKDEMDFNVKVKAK